MRVTISPKNLNQIMGFGKYKMVVVSDVYTGTQNISQVLYRFWFKTFIDIESSIGNFTCFSADELETILTDYPDKLIGRDCIRKSFQTRLCKQVEEDLNRVNNLLPPYYRQNSKSGGSKSSRLDSLKRRFLFDDYFDLVNGEYFDTLSTPFTQKLFTLIDLKFIKNYVIFSPFSVHEDWLSVESFDYFKFMASVVNKYWTDEWWSERWDPPYTSPLLIDLKKTVPPIYEKGKQFILSYGNPDYLEWVLKNTGFFVIPSNLDYLEQLEVNGPPNVHLSKICKDIVEWEVTNTKYKFSFSKDAKFANKCKYEAYEIRQNRLHEPEQDCGDYSSAGTYTDQDFIDDAFGGEADAYWNID